MGDLVSFVSRQGVSVRQRVDARLVRIKELAADLVRLRELMIDARAELVLVESGRYYRNHRAGFRRLGADPAAIEPT